MILKFNLFSVTVLAGSAAYLGAQRSVDAFTTPPHSAVTFVSTSSSTLHSSLGQDWDNGDYLSALSGSQDELQKANDQYLKYADNRQAMNEWRARQMSAPSKSGSGGAGSSTQLNASMGGDDGTYNNNNNNNNPQQQSPQQPMQQQQQQFYDQYGNPVSMPMVYDQNGNLIPFNPQQPPAIPQYPIQPQLTPNPLEPPLPPTSRERQADSPRPVGFNPDTYTMANTADVYFAQLKRDSKVRKEAWLKGDREFANQVFADESVQAIKESWVENPYTREQNRQEAAKEIEGAVRMQVMGSSPQQSTSGMNYRERLQQMKAQRGGNNANVNVNVSPQQSAPAYQAPPPPQYNPPAPVASTPPPPPAPATQQQPQQPPQPRQATPYFQDPVQGSVASVETVLKMYKEATPEEREALMIPLREALMAAAGASTAAIDNSGMLGGGATATAPVSPVVAQAAPVMPVAPIAPATPATPPAMEFPSSYQTATAEATTSSNDALFEENTEKLKKVYDALGNASGGGKFGLKNLSGAEAEELVSTIGVLRTVLLDELNAN